MLLQHYKTLKPGADINRDMVSKKKKKKTALERS